ncbi:MAG: GNAT family N-acetyltransferase [Oscillospiraceae bacterium]|nr:GNAT family N-acetyltransferase [Oscillospiraceae bacterium]
MEIRSYSHYVASEILPLYQAVGWSNYYERPEMLCKAFQNSLCVLGAYEDNTLVGILRAVGDGTSILLIQDILVYPQYQRRGIGTRLVQTALEQYKNVYQIQLMTDNTEKTVAFYRSLGFRPVQEYGGCGFIRM